MAEAVNTPRSSEVVAATTGDDEVVVRCLLMPVHGFNVLMPNTAVAEVIAYESPNSTGQGPAWLKGFYSWRGVTVPVVSFEKLLGMAEGGISSHSRLIIFNSLAADEALPFIAMVAEGIPRLMVLKDSNLHYAPATDGKETGVYARLLLDGNAVVVPDLEVIEKMLVQAGVR